MTGLERAIQHQLSLITDLLDFSRIETGKLRLTMAPILLQQVVESALGAARGLADAKSIKLAFSQHTQDQVVLGDGARLQQVVWNLLSNAIKFTSRGGEINVDVDRKGTHIEIAVRDNGRGIKPEVLPHIFERLRQGESATGRSEGGLGLGLSIVRQLVEMHGGNVRAESEGPGEGSTFTVALPLSPLDLDLGGGKKTRRTLAEHRRPAHPGRRERSRGPRPAVPFARAARRHCDHRRLRR